MKSRWIDKKRLSQCFFTLARLNKLFFQYYASEKSEVELSAHLKKMNQTRRRFFKIITKTRRLTLSSPYSNVLRLLENIYELVFSLHLFRFRMKDFNLFSICARELLAIEQASTKILLNIAMGIFYRKKLQTTDHFFETIQALESLFQHTLKVIVPQPVVFIIFIHDLYTLQEKLTLTKNMLCPVLSQMPDALNS